MKEWVAQGVAIDTNIFKHLLNVGDEGENSDGHITELLNGLALIVPSLNLDNKNKIGAEYEKHITPIILKNDERRTELPILRFWMLTLGRRIVSVDLQDGLMASIKEVVSRAKVVDRVFIAVAIHGDCLFVTNDDHDVIGRRREIRRRTRRYMGPNTRFVNSQEAHTKLTEVVE